MRKRGYVYGPNSTSRVTRDMYLDDEPKYLPGSLIVIACRGMSFELLSKSKYPDLCNILVIVNDWHPSGPPTSVLRHGTKTVNYLTDMASREPRWSEHKVKHLRSKHARSSHSRLIKGLSKEVRVAFDRLWNTKDTGLRAIVIASLRTPNLVIGGLDFWESEYWCDFTRGPGSKEHKEEAYENTQKKRKKGRDSSVEWMSILMGYMRLKTDTRFLFYTHSESLKTMILQSEVPTVSILSDGE